MKQVRGLIKGRQGAIACVLWLFFSLIIIVGRISAGLPVDTNIQSILPNQSLAPAVTAAMTRSGEVAANRVVFLVTDTDNSGRNEAAASDLKQALVNSKLFSDDREEAHSIGKWIFENRKELACEPPNEFDGDTAQTIRKAALAKVYGVGAPITGELLQADPFLLTLRLADCLSRGAANVAGNQSLVSGKLNQSAYRIDTQSQINDLLSTWQKKWKNGGVKLARTGAVFHAGYGAQSAKTEMTLIGGIGLIGVAILFWFVFGRMSNVIVVASLIALSCVSGFATTLLFYSQIHMLVLVFAAMLVGVVADYAVHAMATGVGNDWPNEHYRRSHLLRPMTVSMLTTAAGFAGLMLLGVPMFKQLAVFAVSGVLTAWALVLFVFLPFDRAPKGDVLPLQLRWMRVLSLAINSIPVSLKTFYIAVAIGSATLVGMIMSQSMDDVRQFQTRSFDLMEQEKQLENVVGSMASQTFLVSEGNSLEDAKEQEERALTGLPPNIEAIALTEFSPSKKRREENKSNIEKLLEEPFETLHRAQLGLKPNDVLKDIEAKAILPLWLKDLHVESESGKHYLITRLSNTENWVPQNGGTLVDTAAQYSKAFSKYRKLAAQSLLMAVGFALIFVFVVYRRLGSLSIVLAPAAAMLCGIYLPATLGVPVTFFSMAGAMVLFGVGVDYSAFMWEAGRKREAWTKASVLVGAITTLLSMGLLALSDTLPVRSFGLTVAVGVVCALVFSTLPYYLGQRETGNAK